MMPAIAIGPGDLEDPQVQALLRYHFDQMRTQSPRDACHVLDLSGLRRADIRFYAALEGETLVGIGAIKTLAPAHGELKSMRTHPDHLRKRIGEAMLLHLLAVARASGFTRVSLETGGSEEFVPALRLYEKHGFVLGEPFGGYLPTPFTRFYHLDL